MKTTLGMQGNPIYNVSKDCILLTFDDGPKSRITKQLLKILDEFGVKAYFFVYGQRAVQRPQLLRQIVEAGHKLGNHTWSHITLPKASDKKILHELQLTQELIEKATGSPAKFFRPPHGQITPSQVKMIQEQFNMQTMLWSIDPKDWSSPGADVIHARVINELKGGDIVLLHDRKQTVEALPKILESLSKTQLKTVQIP